MIELKGREGELKAVIHVTRKETGKTETYEIVGRVDHEEAVKAGIVKPEQKEETK
jgi:hypothetical protein